MPRSLGRPLAGLALLLTAVPTAGCAPDPAITPHTQKPAGGPAAYVRCMRGHHVPSFPDPVDGRIQLDPSSGIDPSSSTFKAAEQVCASLAPKGLGAPRRDEPASLRTNPDSVTGSDAGAAQSLGGVARWLEGEAQAGRFSGAVEVQHQGRTLLRAANGRSSLPRGAAITGGTRFNIGSVGKTFTAVAIAQLVEQGKLSFDDRAARWVPGLDGDVTIAQLLTHTAGLGDVFAHWHPAAAEVNVRAATKRALAEPPAGPVGAFRYSNSGYVVLGAIVQAVSGEDYYDYVRRHVLRPAGMRHTGWWRAGRERGLAQGAVHTGGQWRAVTEPEIGGNPSGGAYGTAADLVRFGNALLAHRLLSAAMTDQVLQGRVDTGRPGPAERSQYGYGFEDETFGGLRVVGHGGGSPGNEAQLRIVPDRGIVAVVLANRDRAAQPVVDQLIAAFQAG